MKYKIGIFDSKIQNHKFRFYGITKNDEPHTGFQRLIEKKFKPICCKCGLKPNIFQRWSGLYEWWNYDKEDNVYCDKCAPKDSGVLFIGIFIQYKTNFRW